MRIATLVILMLFSLILASCGSNKIIQEHQARLDGRVMANATGTVYDGAIRIDGTTQFESRRNTFLGNVVNKDVSSVHAPLVMIKHSPMAKVVKRSLIEHGLFYTGDFNKASGLLAPKSKARFGLQIAAVGYRNEVLINKGNIGTRFLDAMASGRPEVFSDEILERGSYQVKAAYHFTLRDRNNDTVIKDQQVTVATTVFVKRNERGYIREDRKVDHEQMLTEAMGRFIRALNSQQSTHQQ